MNEKIIQHSRILFGLILKNLRKEKGLTQNQVADFCGVTYATINKIEQGKLEYSTDLLFKLGVILEFTINLKQKRKWLTKSFFCFKKAKELAIL
jgi:transcriptional regulator with XRE-family HTH domain